MANRSFYEFFAGGGMARLGLGAGWNCLMANDIDPKKTATYKRHFGEAGVVVRDVHDLKSADMPGRADLAWASFPCQDLSLAGNRAGLGGERSGAFWGFWQAMTTLKAEKRQPRLLVLENVIGTLTSHGGEDFKELLHALHLLEYDFGALIVDAIHFLPQSRPRLFIVCVIRGEKVPQKLLADGPISPWHNETLQKAVGLLPSHVRNGWRWWRLPPQPIRNVQLTDLIEEDAAIKTWHSEQETERLLGMMSSTNLDKVKEAQIAGSRVAGTVYKRTRATADHSRVQRAEVRFDGVAGCLRTPGGGSSRQIVIIVEGKRIQSRLLTVREAARLMGVPDSYPIPDNYNDGYHVFGDGLAVPAVSFLREHLLDMLQPHVASATKNAA